MDTSTKVLIALIITLLVIGCINVLVSYLKPVFRLHEPDVEMNGTVHFTELHLAKNCGYVTCHYKFGKDVRLGNAAISGNIQIGDNTSLGKDTEIYGNVKIGKNVVIQSHVYINGREYYKDNGIWYLNMDKATIHNITIPDGTWIPVGSQIRSQADVDKAMIL
jgi:acetyltransferase-like isoleucine patch superfamily enzyme